MRVAGDKSKVIKDYTLNLWHGVKGSKTWKRSIYDIYLNEVCLFCFHNTLTTIDF